MKHSPFLNDTSINVLVNEIKDCFNLFTNITMTWELHMRENSYIVNWMVIIVLSFTVSMLLYNRDRQTMWTKWSPSIAMPGRWYNNGSRWYNNAWQVIQQWQQVLWFRTRSLYLWSKTSVNFKITLKNRRPPRKICWNVIISLILFYRFLAKCGLGNACPPTPHPHSRQRKII